VGLSGRPRAAVWRSPSLRMIVSSSSATTATILAVVEVPNDASGEPLIREQTCRPHHIECPRWQSMEACDSLTDSGLLPAATGKAATSTTCPTSAQQRKLHPPVEPDSRVPNVLSRHSDKPFSLRDQMSYSACQIENRPMVRTSNPKTSEYDKKRRQTGK
jgi:hypothetical protein